MKLGKWNYKKELDIVVGFFIGFKILLIRGFWFINIVVY